MLCVASPYPKAQYSRLCFLTKVVGESSLKVVEKTELTADEKKTFREQESQFCFLGDRQERKRMRSRGFEKRIAPSSRERSWVQFEVFGAAFSLSRS